MTKKYTLGLITRLYLLIANPYHELGIHKTLGQFAKTHDSSSQIKLIEVR